MTRHARAAIAAVAIAVATAACSSAPPPEALDATNPGGAAGAAPGSTAAPGTTAAGGTTTTGAGTAAGPVAGGGTTTGAGGTTTSGGAPGTTTGGPAGAGGAPGTTTGGQAPTRTQLFTPTENTVGITDTSITMCAHAALTYGAAFQTKASDLNVFWTDLNAKGGIYGRKVTVTYENDNYTPTDAITAATACKAKNPFLLLGGIGFDQIPAVRNFVEKNHMLYMHHIATVKGSQGLKYSFTALPTVERMGEAFAQLAAKKYKNSKIGIIERDGANWRPGVDAFLGLAKKYGLNIVAERKVADKKSNYSEDVLAMRNAGADVVWLWENALNATQLLQQAKGQGYSPHWMVFPFNLTSQTLGDQALQPPMDGVAAWPAYSYGDRGGPFSPYKDDLALFEAQYKKYDPNVDLNGVAGDLLFLNWTAQKALAALLFECGKDCTRNKFVDTLQSYKKVPTSSACKIDFADGHHGTTAATFMETYKSPSGKVNWRNTVGCSY